MKHSNNTKVQCYLHLCAIKGKAQSQKALKVVFTQSAREMSIKIYQKQMGETERESVGEREWGRESGWYSYNAAATPIVRIKTELVKIFCCQVMSWTAPPTASSAGGLAGWLVGHKKYPFMIYPSGALFKVAQTCGQLWLRLVARVRLPAATQAAASSILSRDIFNKIVWACPTDISI